VTLVRTLPAALIALALITASIATTRAQEETPAAAETPATGGAAPRVVVVPTLEGETVKAEVNIEDVQNLAGFQFVLIFDGAKLEYERTEIGPFIEGSGREKVCPEPAVSDGAVRVSCVTLRPEPAGPDGSGNLATLYFRKEGHGTAEFSLDRLQLAEPLADLIQAESAGGSVELPDDRSFFEKNWVWLATIGGVALVVVVIAGLTLAFAGRRQRTHVQPDTPQDL
jgi:hypothetical protein